MNGELVPRGAGDWMAAQMGLEFSGLSRKEQRQLAHDESLQKALQEKRYRETMLRMRYTAQAAQTAILAQNAVNQVEESVQTDDPVKRWRTNIIADRTAVTLARYVEDVGG